MNAVSLAAVAIGDQIERVGSYFGFAAIVGLGVLSLLYFAQAREVKRLREWAGRAPERDAELAQRVQTDAQKRVVAQPIPAANAAAAPGAPQTPAAQQADAARQAAAASVMQKVQASGATPAAPAVGPPGQLARPGGLGAPASAAAPATATPGPGSSAPGSQQPDKPGAAAPGQPASGHSPAPAAPVPGAPVPPAPATVGAVAAARQAAAARSPSIANGSGGQETHESAAARPPELPELPSRAARATSAADDGGPSRKRIGLIAGAGAGGLAIVVVLVLLLTGGSDAPPAANEIGPPSASEAPPPPPPSSTPAIDRKATPVAVLNGTTQTGLAGSVADKIEEQGFTINKRFDNDDQTLTTTKVYYADASEPAARLVANIVGVQASALEAMDANNAAKVDPGTKVLVIVGGDVASAG